jgi:anaerobic magnesium-protoporphyrin IX monomethyl ester cyclase
MKILLTHGYFLHEDAAEQKIMMPYPPQGLLHINAYLAQHGIPTSLFDTTFSSFNDLTAFLLEDRPEILGIYCNLLTRINIVKIIRFIRKEESLKNTVIILGGPDVRHHAEDYLAVGADYCIIGEGEETLRELIMQLEASLPRHSSPRMGGLRGASGIRGIMFKDDKGDSISTPERPFIKNIDELPFPDFDKISILHYFNAWKKNHGFTSLTVSTMRGCPYSCKWCSKAVYGISYRRRSPEKVVEELVFLKDHYHPDQYWFVDDVFTISKSWLQDFLHHLRKNNLNIKYECITRADKMDAETVQLLKETGCYKVWIGGESGSQKVLDRMDRRVTAEQVREMIIMSKKAGLETGTFLMLGYPGETIKDIDETISHLKLANPDHFTLTLAYPIKGTDFYDEVATTIKVSISGIFGDHSDRDLDFQRTYKPGFYKHAIRYVHHEIQAFRHNSALKHLSPFFLKHWLIARLSRGFIAFYKNEDS